MLTTPALAQAAEATKAAVDAGAVLLDRGVLGAVCVLLILAVCFLFWRLGRCADKHVALLERGLVGLEAAKDAAEENEKAITGLTAAVAALTRAVETLSRETEGEARETRHALKDVMAGLNGIARRVRATPEASAE